jgi:hypothetical protein
MSPTDSITLFYKTNRKTIAKIKGESHPFNIQCAKFTARTPGITGCNGAYNVFTYFMAIRIVQENMVLEKTQFSAS